MRPKQKYQKRKVNNRGKKIPLRLTHQTAAGLEDAMAVAWDIISELSRAQLYAESRTKRLIEILQELRKGPHAYDHNKAAGTRYTIRKR